KIKALREKIDAEGLGVFIQVDGGINEATIKEAAANGADIFVAGSAVFGAANRKRAVECLRTAI
ncbi:MAG: ribulose-phosphate 3-epimerase, partial [Oscillospiraceae bacterium]|nr:ribulose-phosphate 3-epimerase [Oscillospiraceae bacterium]